MTINLISDYANPANLKLNRLMIDIKAKVFPQIIYVLPVMQKKFQKEHIEVTSLKYKEANMLQIQSTTNLVMTVVAAKLLELDLQTIQLTFVKIALIIDILHCRQMIIK